MTTHPLPPTADPAARTRKQWVDLGKGISMLLVVLNHCEYLVPCSDFTLSHYCSFFRMPFFFFLSGYVFTSDYRHFSLRRKLLQIARGIGWTYLVFTLALLVPKAALHGTPLLSGLADIALGWASWFVVALGGAQVLFALVLHRTQNKACLAWFTLACLLLGYALKLVYTERLPYNFEKTLLVVFFFGLGFFYRIYESRLHEIWKVNAVNLLGLTAIYALLYAADSRWFHTSRTVFGPDSIPVYHHFFLYVTFAVLGIGLMTLAVKLLKPLRSVCFVGTNSLVYYYLNTGVIQVLGACLAATGTLEWLHRLDAGGPLLLTAAVSVVIGGVVWAIKRYCPLLVGDKEAFNRLARKAGWNVRF